MDAGFRRLLVLPALFLAAAGALASAARVPADQKAGAVTFAPAPVEPVAAVATQPSRQPDAETRAIRRSGAPRTSDPGREGASAGTRLSGDWWMWVQTLGILGIVLALMGLVLKALRRAGVGKFFGGSTATIQILSRGYLSNRHQMVLVRFGQRVLLLGLGPQNLDILSEVRDPGEAAEILARLEGGKPGSISQGFQQTIDSAVRQYDREGHPESAVVEPPVTGEAPAIGPLRQELRALLAKMQSIGRKSAD
jgi:flagellar biogenesis protein FliO